MAGKAKKSEQDSAEAKTITAYKGFDKDFKCRGYQYNVGKTYNHDGDVSICAAGFHACENPFDVWGYYDMVGSRFAVVDLAGKIDRNNDGDTKIAAAEITIKAELTLPEFIKSAVNWIVDATKGKDESGDSVRIGSSGRYARIGSSGHSVRIGSSGRYARIGSSGDSAQIGSSGDSAQIGSSGHSARIGSSGDSVRIGSSGHSARIGSSGRYARIGSSGLYAQIGSSGDSVRIGSSGHSARIGSSGDSVRIDASGENAVIASAGYSARVKAKAGAWVSVAEFGDDGKCVGFATGCVGKDGIPDDTWLIAKGGELVPEAA